MKIAVMQPYFFPYIGYFKLISQVDIFVIFDNVNYIKRGWINRNRILVSGQETLLTLPVAKASINRKIMEHEIHEPDISVLSLRHTIERHYANHQYFNEFLPIFLNSIALKSSGLVEFLSSSLAEICQYLKIDTKIIRASDLQVNNEITAENRIISIVKQLGGSSYYNLPGGKSLYKENNFSNSNIELHFMPDVNFSYPQKSKKFIPNLSIIDVLMNVSPDYEGLLS